MRGATVFLQYYVLLSYIYVSTRWPVVAVHSDGERPRDVISGCESGSEDLPIRSDMWLQDRERLV